MGFGLGRSKTCRPITNKGERMSDRDPWSSKTFERPRPTGNPPIRRHSTNAETSEWEIEKQILDYLALRGIFAWPTHGARNKPIVPGMPDILGVLQDGRMVAIEVKSDSGRLRTVQEHFHASLLRNGVVVHVARSLDDVMGVEW